MQGDSCYGMQDIAQKMVKGCVSGMPDAKILAANCSEMRDVGYDMIGMRNVGQNLEGCGMEDPCVPLLFMNMLYMKGECIFHEFNV